MDYQGKWIDFVECSSSLKTKIFAVTTKEGDMLGQIKWHAPWRQYSFFPKEKTVFERQCLIDITRMIHQLMLDRKMLRETKKG